MVRILEPETKMEGLTKLEYELGRTIPADTSHAVSVLLPSWRSNVGYEEGEAWVVSRMTNGYPRFFIHKTITRLAEIIAEEHATTTENIMVLQSSRAGGRFLDFLHRYGSSSDKDQGRILEFVRTSQIHPVAANTGWPQVTAVAYPKEEQKIAKAFWQHTGEGISSRKAEFCVRLFEDGAMVLRGLVEQQERQVKAPKRYRRTESGVTEGGSNDCHSPLGLKYSNAAEVEDGARHVEERFGRNLDINLARNAKLALRRRITGSLRSDTSAENALSLEPESRRSGNKSDLTEDDVYLYPCGMNSIYHTHRNLMLAKGELTSICFGFPYVDTLKILQKFGPGCLFYGNGQDSDLDALETRLENGERFLALFCEFPSNPLLRSPNIQRIRALADKFSFAVVIDETIGNFLNINILPYADVLVSSLTKIFSGDSNVMGGCAILNPNSSMYQNLNRIWKQEYEDTYWPEDAIFMERNSRDFVSRIARINNTAEAICQRLKSHARIKEVFYPQLNHSRPYYDACRTQNGGYGGLLSATFYSTTEAATFYDNMHTEKGPSLGTNFTLVSPFVLLAHYTELEWAAQFGAELNLVRFSIGLENKDELLGKLNVALEALDAVVGKAVNGTITEQ